MGIGGVRFSEIIEYIKKERNSLQLRLIVYLAVLIICALAAVSFIFMGAGVFSFTRDHISQGMSIQLENLCENMATEVSRIEGYTQSMSKALTEIIESEAGEYSTDISAFNDSPDRLKRLQELFYPEISSTLQLSQSTGAYAVIDATTNSSAPNASHSRSGMYVRLYNVSPEYTVNPKLSYFRGIPDIARSRKIELHNRWNLEFDTDKLPGYYEMCQSNFSKISDGTYWTDSQKLPETWEDIVMYCCPITGSDGRVYGMCGVEVSSLTFRMNHAVYENSYGDMISVVAPVTGTKLELQRGLTGEVRDSSLSTHSDLQIIPGRAFSKYISESGETYIGLQSPTKIRGMDGQEWYAAVLMPESVYNSTLFRSRIGWLIAALLFVIMMLIVAFFISKRYVEPIRGSLNAIKEGRTEGASSDISELDELIAYVNTKNKEVSLREDGLPPNIAELFDGFAERVRTLTAAEHNIFMYYVNGHEIAEIPDLAFVSINTVRKHNRSIYDKLKVASKDELMLYVDLFRRCDRIDDLIFPEREKGHDADEKEE